MRQLLSSPQDKGSDGVKELDSMKSDRLRTVQLNVCKSEEVDKAAEVIRSSLEAYAHSITSQLQPSCKKEADLLGKCWGIFFFFFPSC